jgi:hypothetical protein
MRVRRKKRAVRCRLARFLSVEFHGTSLQSTALSVESPRWPPSVPVQGLREPDLSVESA